MLSGTLRYEGSNRLDVLVVLDGCQHGTLVRPGTCMKRISLKDCNPFYLILFLREASMTGDLPPGSMSSSEIEIGAYKPFRPRVDIQETGLTINNLANTELTYEKSMN